MSAAIKITLSKPLQRALLLLKKRGSFEADPPRMTVRMFDLRAHFAILKALGLAKRRIEINYKAVWLITRKGETLADALIAAGVTLPTPATTPPLRYVPSDDRTPTQPTRVLPKPRSGSGGGGRGNAELKACASVVHDWMRLKSLKGK